MIHWSNWRNIGQVDVDKSIADHNVHTQIVLYYLIYLGLNGEYLCMPKATLKDQLHSFMMCIVDTPNSSVYRFLTKQLDRANWDSYAHSSQLQSRAFHLTDSYTHTHLQITWVPFHIKTTVGSASELKTKYIMTYDAFIKVSNFFFKMMR